jgi:hypothetical protein
VIIFLYLDRAIRSEEAGFVDPEPCQTSTKEPDLSKASYGGQNCSLRTDIPGFSINIFSLNQVMKFPLLSTIRTFGKTRLIRGKLTKFRSGIWY